jgi:hypothetical protein
VPHPSQPVWGLPAGSAVPHPGWGPTEGSGAPHAPQPVPDGPPADSGVPHPPHPLWGPRTVRACRTRPSQSGDPGRSRACRTRPSRCGGPRRGKLADRGNGRRPASTAPVPREVGGRACGTVRHSGGRGDRPRATGLGRGWRGTRWTRWCGGCC